jgi:hypothetical protein
MSKDEAKILIGYEAKILIRYYADIIIKHNLDSCNLGNFLKRMTELNQLIWDTETKTNEEPQA